MQLLFRDTRQLRWIDTQITTFVRIDIRDWFGTAATEWNKVGKKCRDR